MKLKLKEMIADVLAYLLQVERKKLLWTNPYPTSGYGANTIPLDLSSYSQIEVWFTIWSSDKRINAVFKAEKNYSTVAHGMASSNTQSSSSNTNIQPMAGTPDPTERAFYFNDNGVVFGEAREGMNGFNTTGNHVLIPYKIYGIKVGGTP